MSSVTHFERDPDGRYTRIEQYLDGETIPKDSTFVAFDSVAFAQSTGQVAISKLQCKAVNNGHLICVDNRDGRWNLSTSLVAGGISTDYHGLGPTLAQTLKDHGVVSPELSADHLQVQQHIDTVDGFDFIGDGPMDLSSENRYNEGLLPAPFSDADTTPHGGLRMATAARLDPRDYLL